MFNKIDELIKIHEELRNKLNKLEEDFFEGVIYYPEFLEKSNEINSIIKKVIKEIEEEVIKND